MSPLHLKPLYALQFDHSPQNPYYDDATSDLDNMCQWSIVVSAFALLLEPVLDELESESESDVFTTFLVGILFTVHVLVIVMAIMPGLFGKILWYYRYYTTDVSAKVMSDSEVGSIKEEASEGTKSKQKGSVAQRAALRTAQDELAAKDNRISELEQLVAQLQQNVTSQGQGQGRSQTGQLQENQLTYSMASNQNEGQHSETVTHATQAAQRLRTFRSAESALLDAAEPGNTSAGGPAGALVPLTGRASAEGVGMELSPKTKSWSQTLRRMVTDIDE